MRFSADLSELHNARLRAGHPSPSGLKHLLNCNCAQPNADPKIILALSQIGCPIHGNVPLAREAAETPRIQRGCRGVLRWARTLPSLRALLLLRGPAIVDDQAVALSSALTAHGTVPQSRSAAVLAGRRQFFIYLFRSILKLGLSRWSVAPSAPHQGAPRLRIVVHEISCQKVGLAYRSVSGALATTSPIDWKSNVQLRNGA